MIESIDTIDEGQKTSVIKLTCDRAINYAFQQNAIPVIKELRFLNDATTRRDLIVRITTEPAFANISEIRLQAVDASAEFSKAPVDIKLSPEFLSDLVENVEGLIKVEVIHNGETICSLVERISLLARNEWCGLVSLPEILAAFILPNDPAVMRILGRASDILADATGKSALNGYQDKDRTRSWEQIAAIYRSIAELGIRYINPAASFEITGQKIRFPSEIIEQRFGTCLDLTLLFAACCEQAGLRPLVLIHEGHAYCGCWLEEQTLPEPADDDLQHIRKLTRDELITVFDTTVLTNEPTENLKNAELIGEKHLWTEKPFKLALDVHRARLARIRPLPIPGQGKLSSEVNVPTHGLSQGIGKRIFADVIQPQSAAPSKSANRIDQWKSRLLDLSLRNRLLNFKETKSTVQILSSDASEVEDKLAAGKDLSVRPKPKVMSEHDPRDSRTYTKQYNEDALRQHLKDELVQGRLHTHLEESEHVRRLTEIYRSARNSLDENGSNTLFAAVGFIEWRETETSSKTLRAPILLVPVELKRKSVLEGFTLRRIDEETRLNFTLMEMLRQHFRKNIPGLETLPEDESGVNVSKVLQLFRMAVRDLKGWEVNEEIWIGQFSFTKFLLWKDLADRLEDLTQNRIVRHLVHEAGTPFLNPPGDIHPKGLDERFHPREVFCTRSVDSSQLAAVMAAAAGHDFVLEGPPGTGKSQTITNIISHCLAEGKRVLFVAEKRAALDVVHRRLREEGLEPFCLELHSNKTGKTEVLAQFDRSLKYAVENTADQWEARAAELGELRKELNEYSRVLHHRYPCGLSARQCLDYLLPRHLDPVVKLNRTASILETTSELMESYRKLAHLMQERNRLLAPVSAHPLGPIQWEEWTPSWADRTFEAMKELDEVVGAVLQASKDLRGWLLAPDQAASRADLANMLALTESLLSSEPVGPDFPMIPWGLASVDLDKLITLANERGQLRDRLRPLQHAVAHSAAVPCEGFESAHAELVFAECRRLRESTGSVVEITKQMCGWLRWPRTFVSRSVLEYMVDLAKTLMEARPVGKTFTTTPWDKLAADLTQWNEWVAERKKIRANLSEYSENKLLIIDLDELLLNWSKAQAGGFPLKQLRLGRIRRELRKARRDKSQPAMEAIGEVITLSLRLREINRLLAAVKPSATFILGEVWAGGEPDVDKLVEVRVWGEKFHQCLISLAGENSDWLNAMKIMLAGIFQKGPSSCAAHSQFGVQLGGFVRSVSSFFEAVSGLASRAALHESQLNSASDYFFALEVVVSEFLETAPRLKVINGDLSSVSAKAFGLLGVLWENGEPSVDKLKKAREWGVAFHGRMASLSKGNQVWLTNLRQLFSSLFSEGHSSYGIDTVAGDRLRGFTNTYGRFIHAFGLFSESVLLDTSEIDSAPDCLPATLELTTQLSKAWPKIRD